jgi:uncharacterized phage protein (TIGR02218 family)
MTYLASESSQWGGQPVELYRFTRGLRIWTYTTADTPILFNGETYTPTTMRRGELPINEEKNSSTLDVFIDPTADVVAEFISGSTPTPTGLILMRRHRDETVATEQAVLFVGQIGQVEFGEGEAHFVCVPIQQSVQRRVPRMLYQTQCNNMLYDVNCTVNPALFTFAGHISAINGLVVTVPEASGKPDGYYNGGYIKDGETFVFIQTHVGTLLTVLAITPALLVGDNITTTAGCDRTRATCVAKFNNLDNFLGFPYIPDQNPFNGLT